MFAILFVVSLSNAKNGSRLLESPPLVAPEVGSIE
jgi:hypothetical protein